MDIKTWIFPSLCFVIFCYGMIFVGFFTYRVSPNVSIYQADEFSESPKQLDWVDQDTARAMKKGMERK